MRMIVIVIAFGACGAPGTTGHTTVDAAAPNDSRSDHDAREPGGDAHGAGDAGSGLSSTLTSPCATLQGRAIVNYNGNLGIAFTDSDASYTFRGSVQFELPDGFTGAVPDPENWDGMSDRHVAAMTDASFDLHGNHCWAAETPPPGSLVIEAFHPNDGVVKATFTSFAMHSCTDTSVCTVSGSIETTGAGVFD